MELPTYVYLQITNFAQNIICIEEMLTTVPRNIYGEIFDIPIAMLIWARDS